MFRNGLDLNLASPDYRDALERGELTLPYCGICGSWQSPWVFLCPVDYRHDVEFRSVDRTGTLHTWASYQRQYPLVRSITVPYIVGQIQLAQGPKISALKALGDDSQLRQGAIVRLVIERGNGPAYPTFSIAKGNDEVKVI